MAKKSEEYGNISASFESEINEYKDMLESFERICGDLSDYNTPAFQGNSAKTSKFNEFRDWCQEHGFLGRLQALTADNLDDVIKKIRDHIVFLEDCKSKNEELQQAHENLETVLGRAGARSSEKKAARDNVKNVEKRNNEKISKSNSSTFWKKGVWNKIKNMYRPLRNANLKFRDLGWGIPSVLLKGGAGWLFGAAFGSTILGPFGITSYAVLSLAKLACFAVPMGVAAFNFGKDRIMGVPDLMEKSETVSIKEMISRVRRGNNKGLNLVNSTVASASRGTPARSTASATHTAGSGPTLGTSAVNAPTRVIKEVKTVDDVEQLMLRIQNGNYSYGEEQMLSKAHSIITAEASRIGFKSISALNDQEKKVMRLAKELRTWGNNRSTFSLGVESKFSTFSASTSPDQIGSFGDYQLALTRRDNCKSTGDVLGYQEESEKLYELNGNSPFKAQAFKRMHAAASLTDPAHKTRAQRAVLETYKKGIDNIETLHRNGVAYQELEKAVFEFWQIFDDSAVATFITPIVNSYGPATNAAVKRYMVYMLNDTQNKEAQAINNSHTSSRP